MVDQTQGEARYWLVQQGRKFTQTRSVEAPDLTTKPEERRKVVFHVSHDLAESQMMAQRLIDHLGATRIGAAL